MAGAAGQALDHLAAREGVADEAQAALGMEALAVEGDDAGRFLAAMLQRVQAERGDRGGVGMAEDAEHAAFLAQPVAVEIDGLGEGSGGRLGVDPSSQPFGPRSAAFMQFRLGAAAKRARAAAPRLESAARPARIGWS